VKVLIIGATGNLGRLTAHALTQQHPTIQLRLTSRSSEGRDALHEAFPTAQISAADWSNEAALREAINGVDKILMVTPDFTTDERVATTNLARAVKDDGGISQVLRFIAIPPGFTVANLTAEQLATRCGAALHVIAKPLLDASGLPVTYVNAACWIMFNLPWFMAEDVKATRRLVMPSSADAARQWVSENDIADVFAKILSDDPSRHIGQDYLVTGGPRYTFAQVAALLGEVLGEKVTYVDDDSALRRTMGANFPTLMTYFSHETQAYSAVPSTQTLEQLLGRPRVSLREYLEQNEATFR
jgi:uncharacterized protein YbjT (DUF2867 family)